MRVDDVMRSPPGEARVGQVIIDVPAVLFSAKRYPVAGQVPVGALGVVLSNPQDRITAERSRWALLGDGHHGSFCFIKPFSQMTVQGGYPGPPDSPPRRRSGPV